MSEPTTKELQVELERINRAADAFMKPLVSLTKLAKSLTLLEQRDKELKRVIAKSEQAAQAAEEEATTRIRTAQGNAAEAEERAKKASIVLTAETARMMEHAKTQADAVTQRAAQSERDAREAVKILEAKQRELTLAIQQSENELKTVQSAVAKARATMAQLLAV